MAARDVMPLSFCAPGNSTDSQIRDAQRGRAERLTGARSVATDEGSRLCNGASGMSFDQNAHRRSFLAALGAGAAALLRKLSQILRAHAA